MIDDKLIFGIPLKPARTSSDWDQVQRNLADTLASIRNSTAKDYVIVIAGHDRPEALGGDVVFLEADFTAPRTANGGPRDKFRKRRLIGAWMREHCRSRARIMFLDADDYVHRDLAGIVLGGAPDLNWAIDKGYRYDIASRTLERVERRFWNSCGSCFVGSFARDELPTGWEDEANRYAGYTNHRELIDITRAAGLEVEKIRFPAAVYVVNHPDSLEMQKHGLKSWNHGKAIDASEEHRILREEFGVAWPDPEAPAAPAPSGTAIVPPAAPAPKPVVAPVPARPPIGQATAAIPASGTAVSDDAASLEGLAAALPVAIAAYFGRKKGVYDLERLAVLDAALDSARHWQTVAPELKFHRSLANLRRDAVRKTPKKGLLLDLGGDLADQTDLADVARDRPIHAVAPNVELAAAVAPLLADAKATIGLLNLEAEDYDAIAAALDAVGDRLRPGSVLTMTTFWNTIGWRRAGYRALAEFAATRGFALEYLGSVKAGKAVSLILR